MFNFISTSRHPEKQTPMHQERGFLRIKPDTNELAFVVSHNFGLTSLEEGTCDEANKEITLETVNITRVSFAKPPYVKKFRRHIKLLDTGLLQVTLFMETDNTELTEHLKAVYRKVEMIGWVCLVLCIFSSQMLISHYVSFIRGWSLGCFSTKTALYLYMDWW